MQRFAWRKRLMKRYDATKVLHRPTPDALSITMRPRIRILGKTTPNGLLASLSLQKVLHRRAARTKIRKAYR